MKTRKTFIVILLAAVFLVSAPAVTEAGSRTVIIIGVGGGIVIVGGAFIIGSVAFFSKKETPPSPLHPEEGGHGKARYVETEELAGFMPDVTPPSPDIPKLEVPAVHVPILTLRF